MNDPKIIAVIPSRLESTRLPEKLLLDLNGLPLIQRVYENVKNFNFFHEIYIATDSEKIENFSKSFGAKIIKTSKHHKSGTSRISEAIKSINGDIFINIQGDEPFIKKNQIIELTQLLIKNSSISIATLIHKTFNLDEALNPNNVKVVKDHNNFALYFSRFAIPFKRDNKNQIPYFIHLGIYAYRRNFLEKYHSLKPCYLEENEKLEQLRFMSNGYKILVNETNEKTIGIDTIEDLNKARSILSSKKE